MAAEFGRVNCSAQHFAEEERKKVAMKKKKAASMEKVMKTKHVSFIAKGRYTNASVFSGRK